METSAIFTKLYGPLALAIFCSIAARYFKPPAGWKFEIPIPYIDIKIPIESRVVVRILLIFAGFVSLSTYAVYDYSSLFPQRLVMQIFYDQPGITRSLQQFSGFQIPNVINRSQFEAGQRKYVKRLDEEVSKLLAVDAFFTAPGGHVHSSGESHTVVKQIQGLQNYFVAESEGELTHVLDLPNSQPIQFYTKNAKLDTGYDTLSFGITNAFRGVLLQTEYKQMLVLSKVGTGVPYQELLLAVTKIKVFPWPEISNTVYFAEEPEGRVPIAYAVFQ